MKTVFIVWGAELEHSRYLAQELQAELKQIYVKKAGGFDLPVFFRYFIQSALSVIFLLRKRPEIVIVQNPPVFLPLLALFYSRLFGARLAIDSHTAAFFDRKWIFFFPLFKFAARLTDLNTCHNYKNLEILKKWGIEKSMVMKPALPNYDQALLKEPFLDHGLAAAVLKAAKAVLVVNRFASDDDWEAVLAAAVIMPDFTFFITGRAPAALAPAISRAPRNVIFTGYLKHDEFMKLMARSQVSLSLTKRKDTVLWSVGEAISLGKPFVASESEVLKKYFSPVGIFTNHRPEDLKAKIEEAYARRQEIGNILPAFADTERKSWRLEALKMKNFLNIK